MSATALNQNQSPTPAPSLSPLATWSRIALIAFAWLFAAGAVVQVFLAGLSLFESAGYWVDHRDFGRMIGILTYVLPVFALLGRVGAPRIGHAFVVSILFIVQMILANIDQGWIAAFHAVNAFLLMGSASSLGSRTLSLVRGETKSETES